MESNRTQTKYAPEGFEFPHNIGSSDNLESRLEELIKLNRETSLEKETFRNENERFEASLLENPLTTKQVFAQFGLMLGLFPPMAMFGKFIYKEILKNPYNDDFWIIFLLIVVNFVCAVTGYFSGKLIGQIVSQIEKLNWTSMLFIAPFIGILWGVMTGAAGGVFIFVIGAFFGAAIAALVGAAALPIFTVFHRFLKKGDVIERDQFLPIALGITFIISAFVLSLKF
jgi:hypothetical protein